MKLVFVDLFKILFLILGRRVGSRRQLLQRRQQVGLGRSRLLHLGRRRPKVFLLFFELKYCLITFVYCLLKIRVIHLSVKHKY
jgi:hypothetical protein